MDNGDNNGALSIAQPCWGLLIFRTLRAQLSRNYNSAGQAS